MSLGFTGHCKRIFELEDDLTSFYAYYGADWNNEFRDKASDIRLDGVIAIDKSVLQWKPAKPRVQTEYIGWADTAIKNGKAIVITECRNAFTRGNLPIEYIALHNDRT